jgi:two-component system nitrate/nitrite response regulator NarL
MRKSGAPSKYDLATVLVEPNNLLREGLAMILNSAQFNVAVSTPILEASFNASLQGGGLRLLVLGAGAKLEETISQITLFKAMNPDGFVAILVDENDLLPDEIAQLFKHGANACLSRVTTGEVLIKSLELIMLGETILSHKPLHALLVGERPRQFGDLGFPPPRSPGETYDEAGKNGAPPLSSQEKRILRCLVEGDSNKAIARKVDIAEATVKVHIKAILRKIRLQNRTQAAVWALSHEAHLSDSADDATSARPALGYEGSGYAVEVAARA